MPGAIVLFSGGQDSTTCLMWAIEKFGVENIYPLCFRYGQKHEVELRQAGIICTEVKCQVPAFLPIEALSILGGAALTDLSVEVEAKAGDYSGNAFAATHGLPSTFVPGRNMLFLTLAAAYGAKKGIYNLVTGVCQADNSGYPDCRQQFVNDAQFALSSALDEEIIIHTPLVLASKAETWRMAHEGGFLDLIINHTHTCYHGDRTQMHEWGAGCGKCPACTERQSGYELFMQSVV